jgi:5-methylcytosine-specific restriction endonuclease McrA
MIEHRFRCCTPGCDNWAWLEIDHVHPRGKGGETSKANLNPLCTPCHRDKSEQDRLIWDDIPYRDSG